MGSFFSPKVRKRASAYPKHPPGFEPLKGGFRAQGHWAASPMLGEGPAARLELLGSGGGRQCPASGPRDADVCSRLAASQGCSAGSLAGPPLSPGPDKPEKRKHTVKGRKHQQTKEGRAR